MKRKSLLLCPDYQAKSSVLAPLFDMPPSALASGAEKMPGLESNQNEPKPTSPSSYDDANDKSCNDSDIRESPQVRLPKRVPQHQRTHPMRPPIPLPLFLLTLLR